MLRDNNHRKSAEFINRQKCIDYICGYQNDKGSDYLKQIVNAKASSLKTSEDEDDFLHHLIELNNATLLDIYRAVKEQERKDRMSSYAEKEPYLFFNQPSADADFAYWLDLEFWTTEQAAALSMGKEPSVVNAESMGGPLRSSSTRLTYRNRSDAILSAHQAEILPHNIPPKIFAAWAIHKKWTIPTELVNCANVPTYQNLEERIKHLEAGIDRLEESRKRSLTASMDELDVRFQRTYYKLILGMAIARYEHRVTAYSKAPSHIVDDLAQLSDAKLSLKVDAVRDALKVAKNYLDIEENSTITPKWFRIK